MQYDQIYLKLNKWAKATGPTLRQLLYHALDEVIQSSKKSPLDFFRIAKDKEDKFFKKLFLLCVDLLPERQLIHTLQGILLGAINIASITKQLDTFASDAKSRKALNELKDSVPPELVCFSDTSHLLFDLDTSLAAAFFIYEKESHKSHFECLDPKRHEAVGLFSAELATLDSTIYGTQITPRSNYHMKRARHGTLPIESKLETILYTYDAYDEYMQAEFAGFINEESISRAFSSIRHSGATTCKTSQKHKTVLKYFGTKAAPTHIYIALHGWLDSSESYHEFAIGANQKDQLVVTYDQCGFGHDANHQSLTLNIGSMLTALRYVHQHILEYFPGVPISLMGHSMGAAVAITYLELFKPKDILSLQAICPAVLSSTGSFLNPARLTRKVDQLEVVARINKELTSSASNVLKQLGTLPQLCNFMLLAYKLFRTHKAVPIHIIAGMQDFCIDYHDIMTLDAANPRIALTLLPNGYHLLHRSRHNSFVIETILDKARPLPIPSPSDTNIPIIPRPLHAKTPTYYPESDEACSKSSTKLYT